MINPDRDMKANFMMIAEIFEPEPKCSIYKLGLQTSISSSRNVNHYITNPLKPKEYVSHQGYSSRESHVEV